LIFSKFIGVSAFRCLWLKLFRHSPIAKNRRRPEDWLPLLALTNGARAYQCTPVETDDSNLVVVLLGKAWMLCFKKWQASLPTGPFDLQNISSRRSHSQLQLWLKSSVLPINQSQLSRAAAHRYQRWRALSTPSRLNYERRESAVPLCRKSSGSHHCGSPHRLKRLHHSALRVWPLVAAVNHLINRQPASANRT